MSDVIPEILARTIRAKQLLSHPDVTAIGDLIVGQAGLERHIAHPRVQKGGLALVGHFRGVVKERVQVLGETEVSFLNTLDPRVQRQRLSAYLAHQLACVVVTRGVAPPSPLVDVARETDTPLVAMRPRSSQSIHVLHRALDDLFTPTEELHAVLVDIHGVGTLLLGPSEIGKSECALFLVERGHRLVADDRVRVVKQPGGPLVGRAPDLLKHHLEVRGIGILNVRDLYGATAVREHAPIDLIVNLVRWDDDTPIERLGLDDSTHTLLETEVPMLRVPVRPGRDMAVILEVAARNHLLKRAGIHSARRFAENLANALGHTEPGS